MSAPPPSQQQRARAREKQTDRREEIALSPRAGVETADNLAAPQAARKQQGLSLQAAQSTAGRQGERNLRIQWIDVWIGNSKPCRFAITSAAGNVLEAQLEQQSYRKTYQGTSSLDTDVVPIAPVGVRGKLIVRDTTTGEVLEQPWVWNSLGGGLLGAFWEWLKSLFT